MKKKSIEYKHSFNGAIKEKERIHICVANEIIEIVSTHMDIAVLMIQMKKIIRKGFIV